MPDTPHNKPDRRPSEAAYWFLFDRDRLLLRHNTDGWYIPLAAEPPVAAAAMEITGQVARTTPGPEPASNTIRYFASSVEGSSRQPGRNGMGRTEGLLRPARRTGVRLGRKSLRTGTLGTQQPLLPGLRYGDGAPLRDFEALSDLRQRAVSGYLSGNHRTDLQRDSISGPHLLFRSPFMGLVAGFLETGESLEACVHREVFEETDCKSEPPFRETNRGPIPAA